MPRLWSDTIDAHRRTVREATLDAVAALVAENGLTAVTMSRVAQDTGIGRATLYKYFPDVDAILLAWHERQITTHLQQLTEIGDQVAEPWRRLCTVLEAYAYMTYERPSTELAAMLHADSHVSHAQEHLQAFIQDLISTAAEHKQARADIRAQELATYCLHALGAARDLTSRAAVKRLLQLTLAALRGPT